MLTCLPISKLKHLSITITSLSQKDHGGVIYYAKRIKRDRFSVALYATVERSPENEKLYANYAPHFTFSVTAELKDVTSRLIILINDKIISNNAKLDSRTKQHTQYGASVSDGSRDMVRAKSWRKKEKKKKNKEKKKKERGQNHIASPTGIVNKQNTATKQWGSWCISRFSTIRGFRCSRVS